MLAVGETREALAQDATPEERAALEPIDFMDPFEPDGFDAEIAVGFLSYVIYDARQGEPWWRQFVKPPLVIEAPSIDAVTSSQRRDFEARICAWGHPALVNGKPARKH